MNLIEIGQGERISLSGSLGGRKAILIRYAFIFVLALVFLNLSNLSHADASTMQFTDIKGHWAESTIYAMVKEGVLEGFPDGTFRPNEPVQVDQFIKMILMALSEEHDTGRRYWKENFSEKTSSYMQNILHHHSLDFQFKNSSNGYWAQTFIDQAKNMTILDLNDNRWSGKYLEKLTREDVAFIALRTTRLFEEEEEFNYMNLAKGEIRDLFLVKHDERDILQVYMKGIMNGYSDGTFGVNQLVTRAEAATILMRIIDKQKRTPYQPDLSGLPYAVVPTEFGDEKTIVFYSWDTKKAFDILQNNRHKSLGYTTLLSGRFGYYEDEETFIRAIEQIDNVETMFAPFLYDIMIEVNKGSDLYNYYTRKDEGIFARHSDSLTPFIEQVFEDDASIFIKHINQKTGDVRRSEFIGESITLNGRTVNFMVSGDGNYVYVYISQKMS